jgi:hypothetical protein
MPKQAYQVPLEHLDHLPEPQTTDIEGVSQIAITSLLMHVGKVASAAGGIHTAAKADAEGDMLEALEVPGPAADVPVAVVGFLSPDKIDEDVIAVEGGMDWEDAPEEMEGVEGPVAVVSVEFNRRFSAHELLKNGIYGFYELLELLSHELAHAFDAEHTQAVEEPDYEKAKGQKGKHKYEFDECEMRARVWAALLVYSHVYILCRLTDRWSDKLTPPNSWDPDAKWHEFVAASPLEDMPLEELNDENRSWLIGRLKEVAPRLFEEYEKEIEIGEMDGPPPLFSVIELANQHCGGKFASAEHATDDQIDEAARRVAEYAADVWQKED